MPPGCHMSLDNWNWPFVRRYPDGTLAFVSVSTRTPRSPKSKTCSYALLSPRGVLSVGFQRKCYTLYQAALAAERHYAYQQKANRNEDLSIVHRVSNDLWVESNLPGNPKDLSPGWEPYNQPFPEDYVATPPCDIPSQAFRDLEDNPDYDAVAVLYAYKGVTAQALKERDEWDWQRAQEEYIYQPLVPLPLQGDTPNDLYLKQLLHLWLIAEADLDYGINYFRKLRNALRSVYNKYPISRTAADGALLTFFLNNDLTDFVAKQVLAENFTEELRIPIQNAHKSFIDFLTPNNKAEEIKKRWFEWDKQFSVNDRYPHLLNIVLRVANNASRERVMQCVSYIARLGHRGTNKSAVNYEARFFGKKGFYKAFPEYLNGKAPLSLLPVEPSTPAPAPVATPTVTPAPIAPLRIRTRWDEWVRATFDSVANTLFIGIACEELGESPTDDQIETCVQQQNWKPRRRWNPKTQRHAVLRLRAFYDYISPNRNPGVDQGYFTDEQFNECLSAYAPEKETPTMPDRIQNLRTALVAVGTPPDRIEKLVQAAIARQTPPPALTEGALRTWTPLLRITGANLNEDTGTWSVGHAWLTYSPNVEAGERLSPLEDGYGWLLLYAPKVAGNLGCDPRDADTLDAFYKAHGVKA